MGAKKLEFNNKKMNRRMSSLDHIPKSTKLEINFDNLHITKNLKKMVPDTKVNLKKNLIHEFNVDHS